MGACKRMKKKILITGSRSFNSLAKMKEIIAENIGLSGNIVIHGGATGVDSYAEAVCNQFSISTIVIEPVRKDIKSYYLHRNAEMIGMADEVIAIWDGVSRGTEFTIEYAKARNKPVKIIRFDEKISRQTKITE